MGRLCEGAHEISGIKAPLFSMGGWGWCRGQWGRVGGGWLGGVGVIVWVVGWVVYW